jgi:type I restriction enzyme M protein
MKYDLIRTDKELGWALEEYTKAVEKTKYWHSNIDWLQKRFPEAKYQDIVGLCKMADREEYADEQDYSLNAGRYVGIVLEDENVSGAEFQEVIQLKIRAFEKLNLSSNKLEGLIESNIKSLFNA